MSALQQIRKKYPALEYFKDIEGVNEHSLTILAGQMHLSAKQMSAECKQILKKVRQCAGKADAKLKKGRKLYKFLQHTQPFISEIIMNNEKLRGLQALSDRSFSQLTHLQLSNNEIEDISPLQTLLVPLLQALDFSSNAIKTIQPINHCNWKHMLTLSLSQNSIQSIQSICFARFQCIKVINLSDNLLTKARSLRKQLSNLKNLRTLDLSFNYISDLRSLSQCHFVDLKLLNLQNNTGVNILQVEKISMNTRREYFGYQIKMTTDWPKNALFLIKFRQISRHKLNAKIQSDKPRMDRSTIQKGRRLIFD